MSAQSTAERILTAAGDVLAGRGYDGFTTAAVAEAAAVSQGTVHHHFPTKADLLAALFARGIEDVAEETDDRVTGEAATDRLLSLADYMINGGIEDEALDVARISLELRHRAMHDETCRMLYTEANAALADLVHEIVAAGVEQGTLREVDADAVTALLVAAIDAAEQEQAIHADAEAGRKIYRGIVYLVEEVLREESAPAEPELTDHDREQLLDRIYHNSGIGASMPAKIDLDGEPFPLREFFFEVADADAIPPGTRGEIEEVLRRLRRTRLARIQAIERTAIDRETAERYVEEVVGLDRAINALESLEDPPLEEQLRRERVDRGAELLDFVQRYG